MGSQFIIRISIGFGDTTQIMNLTTKNLVTEFYEHKREYRRVVHDGRFREDNRRREIGRIERVMEALAGEMARRLAATFQTAPIQVPS